MDHIKSKLFSFYFFIFLAGGLLGNACVEGYSSNISDEGVLPAKETNVAQLERIERVKIILQRITKNAHGSRAKLKQILVEQKQEPYLAAAKTGNNFIERFAQLWSSNGGLANQLVVASTAPDRQLAIDANNVNNLLGIYFTLINQGFTIGEAEVLSLVFATNNLYIAEYYDAIIKKVSPTSISLKWDTFITSELIPAIASVATLTPEIEEKLILLFLKYKTYLILFADESAATKTFGLSSLSAITLSSQIIGATLGRVFLGRL